MACFQLSLRKAKVINTSERSRTSSTLRIRGQCRSRVFLPALTLNDGRTLVDLSPVIRRANSGPYLGMDSHKRGIGTSAFTAQGTEFPLVEHMIPIREERGLASIKPCVFEMTFWQKLVQPHNDLGLVVARPIVFEPRAGNESESDSS